VARETIDLLGVVSQLTKFQLEAKTLAFKKLTSPNIKKQKVLYVHKLTTGSSYQTLPT
jgi:hypothetical protein